MNQALVTILIVCSLALAAWSLVLVVAGRPIGNALFQGVVVLELIALILVGATVVTLIGGEGPEAMATFVSYLVLLPLLLPLATLLALIERTRWGSAVITFVCLVLPVLALRLEQIWSAGV